MKKMIEYNDYLDSNVWKKKSIKIEIGGKAKGKVTYSHCLKSWVSNETN